MSPIAVFCPISCMARRPACGAIVEHAPRARDFTNRRHRHKGLVDDAERAKNRTKSKVRAKVEHAFFVIRRVFGFARVRYRGLDKNAHRLFVACALANLFMARRHLLRARPAWGPTLRQPPGMWRIAKKQLGSPRNHQSNALVKAKSRRSTKSAACAELP